MKFKVNDRVIYNRDKICLVTNKFLNCNAYVIREIYEPKTHGKSDDPEFPFLFPPFVAHEDLLELYKAYHREQKLKSLLL